MRKLIIILFVALGLSSCFKDTAFDTECIIEPVVQAASGDEYIALDGVICYAFEGTTDEWSILSYDDALAGVITSESGEKQVARATSVPYSGDASRLSLRLDKEFMIIVGVDPASQIYCYIDYEVPKNFYEMRTVLSFLPWKVGDYAVKKWKYVVPPFESLEYTLSVGEQVDNAAAVTPLSGTKLYVFEDCSTKEWSVASYDDAVAGLLTSTSSTEQVSATFEAEASAELTSEFTFSLEEGHVMFVVVDTASEVYGYKNYTVTAKERTYSEEVTFNQWQSADYSSNGWSMVVPVVANPDDTTQDTTTQVTENL